MSSITVQARAETHANLRPLNIFRDLPPVADLIEICFSSTMDSEGKRYVQDMRRAGADTSFMQWANRTAEATTLPLTGYVWEENGKIVGNASLVPFRHHKQRIYLIANIATHPDFRQRGIAHALTQRALQHAKEKNADQIWLHVRDDNPAAINLYTKLGFVERARRTSWQAATDLNVNNPWPEITITKRHPRYWQTQLNWLNRLYPDFLSWHRNWNINSLRPGFWNWLYLFFVDMNVRQWAAVKDGSLNAALAWIPYGRGESLFVAAGERSAPEAVSGLLIQARHDLFHLYPNIALEFPAGQFDEAIRKAGFRALRTLIWMQAT